MMEEGKADDVHVEGCRMAFDGMRNSHGRHPSLVGIPRVLVEWDFLCCPEE